MASAVTRTPRAFPRRTASTDAAALMWAMWTRPRVSSASRMSRSTMMASPTAGLPRSPRTVGDRPLVHCRSLGQGRLLAVVDHRKVEGARVLERAAHHPRAGHRVAVVRHGHAAGLAQVAVLGQLLALRLAGDGSDRVDAHHGGGAGSLQDRARHLRPIVDRRGVGHGADGREPASRCGPRPCGDGLLVLPPRLPQMDVDVDESRADDLPAHVQNLGAPRLGSRGDLGYPPVLQQDVEIVVDATGGVDDAAALEQETRAHDAASPPPRSR